MRNFLTWLIANGLKQRQFAGKAQLRAAWVAYVKWLCGANEGTCESILKKTKPLIDEVHEANTLTKLQELDGISFQLLKEHPTLKPTQPIDQFGSAVDASRSQNKTGLVLTPPPSTKPLGMNVMFPSRAFAPDFTELGARISTEGIGRVMAIKSGTAQYSSPGIAVPPDSRDCLRLFNMILSHRIGLVVRAQPHFTCAPITWGAKAPIYVVSSNRSGWLTKNLKKGTFYGKLIGQRPIIFVVGDNEAATYGEILKLKGQGTANGVYVLSCAGGFGMGWNRHCALLHAKAHRQPFVWMLDDNLLDIKQSGSSLADLDDSWIGEHMVMPLYPGIMQQALGFNLAKMKELNFCPLFTYSKEDLSLELLLIYLHSQQAYMEPPCSVFKVDKTTITADFAHGIPGRNDNMARVAALPMWKTDTDKPLELLKMGVSPYLVMKFQEQVLYDCLQVMRPDLAALRALAMAWFVDLELWDLP